MASTSFLPRIRVSQRTGEIAELAAQLNELIDTYNSNFTGVDASVLNSGTYTKANPSHGIVANSDTAGTFTAITAPDGDIELKFYDNTDTEVASRTIRGTMDANGDWTVGTGAQASSGLTTSHTIVGTNPSMSVRAEVMVTFANGEFFVREIAWSAVDEFSGGLTPSTGGGK